MRKQCAPLTLIVSCLFMTREADKEDYETTVFNEFLDRSCISINRGCIRKGNPHDGEPDFICSHLDGVETGFELGRLLDPNLAQVELKWEPINGEYIRTSDPSEELARKSLVNLCRFGTRRACTL